MDMNRKQRMIGIVVLIALAVIAIPVFFQFSKTQNLDNLSQNIPAEPTVPDVEIAESFDDEIDLSSLDDFEMNVEETEKQKVAKEDVQTATTTKQVATTKTPNEEKQISQVAVNTTTPEKTTEVKPTPTSIQTATETKAPIIAKTTTPPTPKKKIIAKKKVQPLPKPENWAVQLGSFQDKQNANKLITQLRKKGLSAFSKESTLNQKRITRVFVGPTTDTIKAHKMIQQLNKEFQIKAILVRYKV